MNKRISARTLNFCDFLTSETYQMLIDPEMELYKVSPLIIFDMWETEKVTGNPRQSIYIR